MEKNSEYSLKWNNHQSTVLNAMNNLFNNERHADCTLASEGKSLKVHKLMISACSPYLEKLLEEHSQDKSSQPIIIFNDVTFLELKALCEYMYKGEVNIPQEKLESFLKVARNMQIRGLCDQGSSSETPATPGAVTPAPAPSTPVQTKQDKAKLTAKRKREGPSDPPWEAKPPAKTKRAEAAVVASCSPIKVKTEKPPEPKDIVKTEEEDYDENYPEYGNDVYQDNNVAGPSSESLEYPWNEGGNEFSNADNGSNDQDVEMFYCLSCGKMYKKMKSLRSHLRYECGKTPSYACPHCPYKSKQKGYLNQHIYIKHTEDSKVYQCETCGYSTKYKSNYNIHLKSSHRRKKVTSVKSSDEGSKEVFLCSSCGSMFSKASLLTRHMKNSCNTSYKCPHCPYTNIKSKVSMHVKTKHTPNSPVLFKCGHCDFMTKLLPLLQAHVSSQHTVEVPKEKGGVTPITATIIVAKEEVEDEEEVVIKTSEEEKEEYSEMVEEVSDDIVEETVVLTEETQEF